MQADARLRCAGYLHRQQCAACAPRTPRIFHRAAACAGTPSRRRGTRAACWMMRCVLRALRVLHELRELRVLRALHLPVLRELRALRALRALRVLRVLRALRASGGRAARARPHPASARPRRRAPPPSIRVAGRRAGPSSLPRRSLQADTCAGLARRCPAVATVRLGLSGTRLGCADRDRRACGSSGSLARVAPT